LIRTVAAAAIGLVLLGAAYQSSLAAQGGGGGSGPSYGGGGGLSGGVIAGIAVGGAAAIAAALGLFGGAAAAGAFAIGSATECKERYDPLPAGQTQLSAIRLVPSNSDIRAGYCRCFHLEVKSAGNSKWYSVTFNNDATIDFRDPTDCVVKQQGSKNIFCVPTTVRQSCNGQHVTLVGAFRPPGAPAMTAEAVIQVRVGGDVGAPEGTLER